MGAISMRLLLAIFSMALFTACDNDDDPTGSTPTGTSTMYILAPVNNSGVSGTVTFAELSDNSTRITISLNGTPANGDHPTHIHMNTAAEGGVIAVSLTNVDGNTGSSVTDVAALDDGTAITYSQLIAYDGYINVHLSADDLATIVAQGDIGQNALTGNAVTYPLEERVEGISGTAVFAERENGTTLVSVSLEGTPMGGVHPTHIHMNTAAEGGDIAVSLTPVDGTSGTSLTQVASFDDGTAVTYAS